MPDYTQLDLSGNRVTSKSACITLIHKAATMTSLNIHNCMSNCGIKIDTEIAEAISRLPDHTELDLSGNQVRDKSACITLIHKAATMTSLNIHNCMSNCGIKIDTEIAEAISRLPDHTELDLSGNQVRDKSACITLIHKAATMTSLNIHNCMSNCGIKIDTEIAEAVSRLPVYTELDLSGNRVTSKSACIKLMQKAATMTSLNIHNCMSNCGIKIDTEIAEAVSRLPDRTQLDLSGNQVTDKSACITLIHKAATMKSLNLHNCMSNCGIQIDTEIAKAVSKLPDHKQLDLSGNQVTDKSACITLINKATTMKSLSICNCMSNCGIQIDREIAEAVSRLPVHTELDLSGNQVTDKSACITLLHKAVTMKSLNIHDCMSNCGIQIDTEIAEAVSRLPDHTQLDLSGNQVTDKSTCITLIHKAATMKSLNIHDCMYNCGIQIDTEIAEAVSRLSDHTQLDLSGNKVTDKSACIILIHKAATMKSLNIHDCMSNCHIQIDKEIAEAVSRLPDNTQLDLSGNHVTNKSACMILLHKAATMKSISIDYCMSYCGIQIDTEIAEAVSKLPDDTRLYLSGNHVTNKSACMTLIHKATTMKSLNIHDCMSNCGIQIDTEIAEAVSRLPVHTELDLSGNQVTDKSTCITLIHKAAAMKSLNIHDCMSNCGIQIDTEIAEAVSRLSDHTQLDLSGNYVTDKSACIILIHKAATMKSLNIHDCMSNCDIQIDKEIAEAASRLSDHTQLDLSGNHVTDKSACIILIHKAATMKSLNIHDCMSNCDIQIDKEIAEAVSRLSDHTQLDLSGNHVTDKSACMILLHKAATMKSISIDYCMSNCGIQIDTEIAEAVSKLPDDTHLYLSGNQVTDKSECMTLIHKATTMKSLSICNCGIQIDLEIAEVVSRLPDHTQLDLSGNQVTDKSACITLIHKAAAMKSLNIHDCMSNCGIQIDTEIAEAVSRLSDHTQLDLSGNHVTDKSACIILIHKAATMKSLNIHDCMSNCDIQIDKEIAEAASRLSDHTQLDLSGNHVTDKSACIILIHKAATMKSLNIHDCMSNCDIQIDKEIAEAVSRLSDHTQLDLSGNHVTDKSACMILLHKAATMKSISIDYCMSNCGIQIDTEIAEAVSKLPDDTHLYLSGNQVTDKSACMTLIHKATTMKSLSICNCGIQIDLEIAEVVSRLPDHTQLDLSGNQVTDKSACITLIHKAAAMKSLNIHDCMSNCGIQIDTEIAEAVSRLSDHTQLDLSGNHVTDKSACIILIHKAATMKSLNIHDCMSNCDIQIDKEIAEAASRLSDHTQLDLSGNHVTDKSACIILIHKAATMKSLNIHDCMSNCDIQIDKEIAEAVSRLSDHTQLDLSGNHVTDKSACMILLHKAATMKSISIDYCMSNCGIQIDTEIAEAVSKLPDDTHLYLSGNQVTDKSACMTLIHKATTMKSLSICNCGIQIDLEIAEVVSRLPDHTQLDLSGNQVTDKSACITLIHKAATMKSLIIPKCMSNCGMKIDTEIAEAVSRLSDHTQLDLSGNQVTDTSACIILIHKAVTMKSLNIHDCMSYCDIEIDKEIAEAVSRLPDYTEFDLSGNRFTEESACMTLIHKASTMKSLSLCDCGIQIDAEIAEAVSRLPDHAKLDLSSNQVTDKSACITLIHKASTMKSLSICDCGIQIDTEIAEAVSRLPDHRQLDLSGNQVTDKSAFITLIHKAATMKSLSICDCGIQIDTEIAEAVSRLPDYAQLDLSGNQVTDKSACITLIHKAATMKGLNIDNCMSNCGIQIDTEIAEAVSRLPDHAQLNLSGNKVTDKSACITLIHKAATMKSLSIYNCGIQIDTEIAEAVSRLPDDIHLDLSGNQVTDKSACITLIHKAETMKSLSTCNCGIQIDTEIAEAVSRLPDHTQLDLSGNKVTDKSACITLIHKAATMKSLNIHNCMSNCGIQIDTKMAEAVLRLPGHTQLDLSGNDITKIDPYSLSKLLPYMKKQD